VEPGTPLHRDVAAGVKRHPDADLQRDMFEWMRDRLAAAGYGMYEISNFARPGRRSEHNMRYWTGRPFLGLGPSAHSCMDGRRGVNPARLDAYRASFLTTEPEDPFRDVRPADLMFERVFMALRLTDGLDEAEFADEFGVSMEDVYPGTVERLVRQGWMVREGTRIRLAPGAFFVSDAIFSEFARPENPPARIPV
jgi:oxygen-independent coproporphyrinogen-3 oxidase